MTVTVKKEHEVMFIQIETEGEKPLLNLLRDNNFYLDAPCGGRGICGKCKILVLKGGGCPERKEKEFFSEEDLREGWRLACCVHPEEDCEIFLSDDGKTKIDVTTEFIASEKIAETKEAEEISCHHNKRREETKEKEVFGIAIDIGTTTLAAVLVNLNTGERKKTVTGVNHQRSFGADVVARMLASNEGKAEELRACICSDLERMMAQAAEYAGAVSGQIKKIVIAGNTAMCHLLLLYSCKTLSAAPFIPVDISLQRKKCKEVFAGSPFDAEVILLPGISAFVGADITAGILSSGMDEKTGKAMLIDLGTNGEMVIGNKEGFLVTSAAAGPAFEGGNISCGMLGIPGAVTHVSIADQDEGYQIRYETIRGEEPTGLCGSGIIDTVYELVMHGLMDENGTLEEPWFQEGFPVAGRSVQFTQSDIREIQMAKSAIRAGIETLIREAHIMPKALDTVYLAGGFGYGIDVEKAIGIGIFPQEFAGKVKIIGNSALEGAINALCDESVTERMERIAASSKEINLAMNQNFNELYLEHMFFT